MKKKAILKISPGGDRVRTHHGFQAAAGAWPETHHGFTHHGFTHHGFGGGDPEVSLATHHGFLLTFSEAPRQIFVERDEQGNLVLSFGE
jgi:hypothetical protein